MAPPPGPTCVFVTFNKLTVPAEWLVRVVIFTIGESPDDVIGRLALLTFKTGFIRLFWGLISNEPVVTVVPIPTLPLFTNIDPVICNVFGIQTILLLPVNVPKLAYWRAPEGPIAVPPPPIPVNPLPSPKNEPEKVPLWTPV